MTGATDDLAQIRAQGLAFADGFRSAVLGTASAAGEPLASYAPFVRDGRGCCYVFVSDLAAHTGQLRASARTSLLLIEDEGKAAQSFARQRLTFQCRAEAVPRSDAGWVARIDEFEARFGNVVAVLRELGDFTLFRLVPVAGVFVLGFGRAYRFDGPRLEGLAPMRGR